MADEKDIGNLDIGYGEVKVPFWLYGYIDMRADG